jgi:hypothetical protein
MQFELLASISLPVQPALTWLWYSRSMDSFIVGDERSAFALPVAKPTALTPLNPPRQTMELPLHPCNLPIPASRYEDFVAEQWHGFQFLEWSAYDSAVDKNGHPVGDLLRTLVFGPDYGHYVLHPPSGLILSLRSGSMELLRRSAGGFESIDRTKTRGGAALAFAGHPTESMIGYGDNAGTFYAHRFDAAGFGKATKIAARERKASRLEFVNAGGTLLIGGMGYLASYLYSNGKFAPVHEVSTSVRDFTWLADTATVLVNQGLHGVTAYRYDQGGFNKLGGFKPEGSAQQIAVSACGRYLAVSFQESSNLNVYAVAQI